MPVDAQELTRFYDEQLGQIARRLIARRIRAAWPDLKGASVLGLGFTPPYLKPFLGEAARVVALVPAEHEIDPWPASRVMVALGQEDSLPFPDASFDRVLLVHGLETAESIRHTMRQIWRVLSPDGRLLLVVPHRASLWAQAELSPFAHGRPFNRGQLDRLLREAMFTPELWDTALFFPPFRVRRFVRDGMGWERLGKTLWPRLSGVLIVEATKSLYALVPPAKLRVARHMLATARN